MKRDEHLHIEEEFHAATDRKRSRKERKQATGQDRSKYKKTDLDKRKVAEIPKHLKRGRVLAIHPEGRVIIDHNGKILDCTLRGVLKKERKRDKNIVTIGDFVRFDPNDLSIHSVDERYSILSRAETLGHKKQQLIAANIDQVFITSSVVLPPLKPSLVDRYIIAAMKGNMRPFILLNKTDLLSHIPDNYNPADFEKELKLYKEFIDAYVKLDIPLLEISVETGEGIPQLKAAMHGKTSVFSGQSGVGKSSLINAVLGSELQTGQVIGKTRKGTHTTTSAHLLPVEGGGFCVDTPGIKSFGIWELKSEEIQNYFSEISEASSHCKFKDCSHTEEPECAVQKALKKGTISRLRFDSFSALMLETQKKHLRR